MLVLFEGRFPICQVLVKTYPVEVEGGRLYSVLKLYIRQRWTIVLSLVIVDEIKGWFPTLSSLSQDLSGRSRGLSTIFRRLFVYLLSLGSVPRYVYQMILSLVTQRILKNICGVY